MEHKLFVYGSLKAGQRNHGCLGNARFLLYGSTVNKYGLYDLGSFPAMTHAGNVNVCGEIYEIDDEILRRCDALEGHPHFYKRELITVGVSHNMVVEDVWAYFYQRDPSAYAVAIDRWPARKESNFAISTNNE